MRQLTLVPFKVLAILIPVIFFTACQLNSETGELRTYPLVDEDLWPYFQNFEEEALRRGYNIDLNLLEVTGLILTIPQQGVAGTCTYGAHINEVNIDVSYWNNSNVLRREYVVFHELGHCVLHRDHLEDADNGNCLSLMNSGTAGCDVAYNPTNRDFYIDELFDGVE